MRLIEWAFGIGTVSVVCVVWYLLEWRRFRTMAKVLERRGLSMQESDEEPSSMPWAIKWHAYGTVDGRPLVVTEFENCFSARRFGAHRTTIVSTPCTGSEPPLIVRRTSRMSRLFGAAPTFTGDASFDRRWAVQANRVDECARILSPRVRGVIQSFRWSRAVEIGGGRVCVEVSPPLRNARIVNLIDELLLLAEAVAPQRPAAK